MNAMKMHFASDLVWADLGSPEEQDAARERMMQLRPPSTYRQPSIVMTWRCQGCRGHWTLEGSHALGRCITCGRAKPDA